MGDLNNINISKIILKKQTLKLFIFISLYIFSMMINSCNQATLNPFEVPDEKKKAEELHKNTKNILLKTWQLSNIPIDMQNINIIPTLKFEENGTLISTVLFKSFLTWELTTDSKYIITKDDQYNTIDTLKINLIDENNLIVEVVNDENPDLTILEYVPFNPEISKFNIRGFVNNSGEFSFEHFVEFGPIRLVTIWEVYQNGSLHQYVWGNQIHNLTDYNDMNAYSFYELMYEQAPPAKFLNFVNFDTYFGFGKVILTYQKDLPQEGLVTNLDDSAILGGFSSKVIIYKKGEGADPLRLWLNNFPEGYSLADYSYSTQASNYWLNLSIYPPYLELGRNNLIIPKL
jgi:hypothetical protein